MAPAIHTVVKTAGPMGAAQRRERVNTCNRLYGRELCARCSEMTQFLQWNHTLLDDISAVNINHKLFIFPDEAGIARRRPTW